MSFALLTRSVWAHTKYTKSTKGLHRYARNGANAEQTYKFTLRKALNIPANVNGSIILRSARAFLLYSEVEGLTNTICSSNGKKVGSVEYSLTDPNLQFRIELKEGKYYLYSVGAGKYVNSNGNYVDTASTELKIENVGGGYPWKLILGSNGMNSQDGGQTDSGILVNYWVTTDAGNCYQIIEAGELKEEEPGAGIQYSELNNLDSGVIYDLQGRKVETPTKGIYIKGNRKVVL